MRIRKPSKQTVSYRNTLTHQPFIAIRVILRDASHSKWLRFEVPLRVVTTTRIDEVTAKLTYVENAVEKDGLFAAGFIAYEAAPAFDRSLTVFADGTFPLIWFGLFNRPTEIGDPCGSDALHERLDWQPTVSSGEYRERFNRIRRYIHAGDTYQVNYTLRLRALDLQHPWNFFTALLSGQQPRYGAFIQTDDWAIASASPELFFRLDGERIESRPMKGTIGRGLWPEDDADRVNRLYQSEKNRAENVMITDMVRNDMGRIALPGSVYVPELFTVEKYSTVWQMTSTVRAKTQASVVSIFKALFPAASITGAPKHRTMQIIAELETTPRRIYTGAIGFMAPGRKAQFNVAIRTVLMDRKTGSAEYGTGGGIVWDSTADDEEAEWRTKANILKARPQSFDLVETLLWTPSDGLFLIDGHLKRLSQSADYFNFSIDLESIKRDLEALAEKLPKRPHKIRLILAKNGDFKMESSIVVQFSSPPKVIMASTAIDSSIVFLYHKTTERRIYQQALEEQPGFDDVLMFNQRNEITESTIANVAVEIHGELVTPPIHCGLLQGVFRAWMLEQGKLKERPVTVEEVLRSPRVCLMNSVRGIYDVQIFRQK